MAQKKENGAYILELLRELQRSNGAIGKLYGGNLTLADSHSIIELTSNPHLSTVELASIVGIDQSSISRLLSKLVKQKILAKKKIDGRTAHLLTTSGTRLLKSINTSADKLNRHRIARISSSDHDWFFGVFDELCTAMGATIAARQPGEQVFRPIQRRVARMLGMVQGVVADSTLATSHWHILSELIRFSDPVDLDRLTDRLALERSILVAALHALRLKGWIRSHDAGLDSRKTLYSITDLGRKKLREALTPIERAISSAIARFDDRKLARFTKLFESFIEYSPAGEAVSALKEYTFSTVSDHTARAKIRSAYVKWIVRDGHEDAVPARLFGQEEVTFALYSSKGKVVACAQAELVDNAVVLSAVASDGSLSKDELRSFVARCQGQLPKGATTESLPTS